MQIEAYCDEGKFIPFQPVRIPNGRRAIITILDSPIQDANDVTVSDESRMEWLKRLSEARELAKDEHLPSWPFERSKELRPPIDLSDAGDGMV